MHRVGGPKSALTDKRNSFNSLTHKRAESVTESCAVGCTRAPVSERTPGLWVRGHSEKPRDENIKKHLGKNSRESFLIMIDC